MLSSLRMAQIVGVSGAMWLSGNIATLSLISIPALQRSALEDGVSALTLAKESARLSRLERHRTHPWPP
ncbi:hypothetical protein C349_01250 [Cryptococcus neoformans var. grubii Br795]|uniref:Uncharacterized protein n=1 Tax=Cryptococcus neoformans Tu259-1 TaxID=1230072 RepID=A0A854QGH8_CRYNE|nr:hypothetical protein C353_01172 [Cryptococcus neoformans var. grubii AD1-83a]OWZ56947.1 hypothetical protein C368_01660 [Cryptococcus neoformans var. grubii 125.91]OXG27342.1 hypothetical protein C361_01145 [Cryptococcus neoformans var. grubii Tu259-1]OXG38767.1 hypothetical protein C360_01193 [Cryptococcus neoformans var. grubii Bt15]OXG44586.1 hypothetical protein C359_00757 [Cryptococcus neoformans var. grubii Bt120]OXG62832.1 hypothetical protein C351_03527 [Cryptococcus neoformans var.